MNLLLILLVLSCSYACLLAQGPPAMSCNELPDSIDLMLLSVYGDKKYYFFVGAYFYTSHEPSKNFTAPRLITSLFPNVQYPVVAAFSIFPNGFLYIIDSAPASSNVKVYAPHRIQGDGTALYFPPPYSGAFDVIFPKPKSGPYTAGFAKLNAANSISFQSFSNPKADVVTFYGILPSGKEAFMQYTLPRETSLWTFIGVNEQEQPAWGKNVRAVTLAWGEPGSTPYYYVISQTGQISKKQAEVNVVEGPAPLSSCPSWMAPVTSPTCCAHLITTTPAPTTPTTPTTTTTMTTTTSTTTASTTPETTSTTTPSTTTATTTPTTTTSTTGTTSTSLATTSKPPIPSELTPTVGFGSSGCCGGCDTSLVLQGWRATSKDQTITIGSMAESGRDCLRKCRALDSRCRLVSFDLDSLKCEGFTGKAMPEVKRDFNAVLLSVGSNKLLLPVDSSFPACQGSGVEQGAGQKVKVAGAGHMKVCQQLCALHPRCVSVDFKGGSHSECTLTVCPMANAV